MKHEKSVDELIHAGVVGMRWGHRKKKDINKMSDDDIKKLIERTKLENEYYQTKDTVNANKLKALGSEKVANAKTSSKTSMFAKKIVSNIGEGLLSSVKQSSQLLFNKIFGNMIGSMFSNNNNNNKNNDAKKNKNVDEPIKDVLSKKSNTKVKQPKEHKKLLDKLEIPTRVKEIEPRVNKKESKKIQDILKTLGQ